jgi:hypothetical protein
MKLRHAAALALVGWYLMLAPSYDGLFEERAPLSQWQWQGSYDTKVECFQTLAWKLHDAQLKHKVFATVDGSERLRCDFNNINLGCDAANMNIYVVYKCVATDDPRLKEK